VDGSELNQEDLHVPSHACYLGSSIHICSVKAMLPIEVETMAKFDRDNSGTHLEGDAVKGNSNRSNSDETALPPAGRGRSLSMATSQPSVETVVVKAKRAASSLWLLLHAQVRARSLPFYWSTICSFLSKQSPLIIFLNTELYQHRRKMPISRLSGSEATSFAFKDMHICIGSMRGRSWVPHWL
jgi:hypothetical protein